MKKSSRSALSDAKAALEKNAPRNSIEQINWLILLVTRSLKLCIPEVL
ncbi:hypothetical protein [Parasphingorhabdus sp.]